MPPIPADPMLVEFSIVPLRGGPEVRHDLAEALRLVHASGLPYVVTPSGTIVEGAWEEVMPLVRRCHEAVRERSSRLVTLLKIEDDGETRDKLTGNVAAVEAAVGHALGRLPE